MPVSNGFKYTNQYNDINTDDWTPGDPWENHYTTVLGDLDRDSDLETYLGAERDFRPFTFTLTQNAAAIAHANSESTFTVGAWVEGEIVAILNTAGSAGFPLKMQTIGIPLPRYPDANRRYNVGSFAYSDTGAGFYVGVVWYAPFGPLGEFGFYVHQTGGPAGALGVIPAIATASTDAMHIQLRYRPAV